MLINQLKSIVNNINQIVETIIRNSLFPNGPAVSVIGLPSILNKPLFQPEIKNSLEESIVWMPTPKKRTTSEKKKTRQFLDFPTTGMQKYAKPKTDIIACLNCGNYHQVGSICGKCYEKVKKETELLMKQMNQNELNYSHPQQEIAYVYETDKEVKDKLKNKKIVEVPRERPSWFNGNLMAKVKTEK